MQEVFAHYQARIEYIDNTRYPFSNKNLTHSTLELNNDQLG